MKVSGQLKNVEFNDQAVSKRRTVVWQFLSLVSFIVFCSGVGRSDVPVPKKIFFEETGIDISKKISEIAENTEQPPLEQRLAAFPFGRSPERFFTDLSDPRIIFGYKKFSYIGFTPRIRQLEVINLDKRTGRNEFYIVKNFGTPQVQAFRANRTICLNCHQSGLAILANPLWSEAMGSGRLFTSGKLIYDYNNLSKYGFKPLPPNQGEKDTPNAPNISLFDRNIRESAKKIQSHTLFRELCFDIECKKLVFKAAFSSLEEVERQRLKQIFLARWPRDSFGYHSTRLPDRLLTLNEQGKIIRSQLVNQRKNEDLVVTINKSYFSEDAFFFGPYRIDDDPEDFSDPKRKRPIIGAFGVEDFLNGKMELNTIQLVAGRFFDIFTGGLGLSDPYFQRLNSYDRGMEDSPEIIKLLTISWPPERENLLATMDAVRNKKTPPAPIKFALPPIPEVEVAPIQDSNPFVVHCSQCHKKGAVAPELPLTDIKGLKKYVPTMGQNVLGLIRSKIMPLKNISDSEREKLIRLLE